MKMNKNQKTSKQMISMCIRLLLLAVAVTRFDVRDIAQFDRAGLAGTVKDFANRNIPAATVIASQLAHGTAVQDGSLRKRNL
jgi:hypothetical protein